MMKDSSSTAEENYYNVNHTCYRQNDSYTAL